MSEKGLMFLWKKAFKLSEWHFIVKAGSGISETMPFTDEFDGKGWFYLFTDGYHVNQFAALHGLVDENGTAKTIAMYPAKTAEWITKH
jgi:hypothetical protein